MSRSKDTKGKDQPRCCVIHYTSAPVMRPVLKYVNDSYLKSVLFITLITTFSVSLFTLTADQGIRKFLYSLNIKRKCVWTSIKQY